MYYGDGNMDDVKIINLDDTLSVGSVPSGIGPGDVVVLYENSIVGVVVSTNTRPATVRTAGKVIAPKDNSVVTKGQQLYWDNTNRKVTTTNTGVKFGMALKAASDTATLVEALLNA
jgi:predicted RecA/RadA family phage recombinase